MIVGSFEGDRKIPRKRDKALGVRGGRRVSREKRKRERERGRESDKDERVDEGRTENELSRLAPTVVREHGRVVRVRRARSGER